MKNNPDNSRSALLPHLTRSAGPDGLRPSSFHWLVWVAAACLCQVGSASEVANWWLTTPDKAALLAKQATSLPFEALTPNAGPTIVVDATQPSQSIDGFGLALTGGSADHIVCLPAPQRKALLEELFSAQGAGIGLSYLRVSIGASDMNQRVFSYDDMPPGQTDEKLAHFNLSEDRSNIVPVLKEILAINPTIKILGSPWSAPTWMKTNDKVKGGELRPECYAVYAQYFVRYVEEMAKEGILIDAVTVQNEPLNPKNTPSMLMFAKEQTEFIKRHLGPAFQAAGIKTKIILYDHNCDVPEYAISILTDPDARKFVDGSGFHLYSGPITAMTAVHDKFPDKALYFTEMMAVDPHGFNIAKPVSDILIGATRNWSRNVLLWNLAANAKFEPHTGDGGCDICQGAITIEDGQVERNLAYYVIGHAAKFVPAGSIRIKSTDEPLLPNVAFRTPANQLVLIVANRGEAPRQFNITSAGKTMRAELTAGAVATFVW